MNHSTKRIIVASLAILAALVFIFWFFYPSLNKSKTDEISVGAVFTLTGGTAYWSEQLKKGMDIAVEEENAGEQIPVKVIYEDVQGQPQQAVSTFQKLVELNKVSAVLSVFTPISQPLRSPADNAQVPLLATVVSVRDFGKDHPWSLRDFPTQEQMAAPLGVYAWQKLGLKSAAALFVNDDYGRDGAIAFSDAFKKQGGEWLGEETFAQKDIDLRAQSVKIAALNPQAIFVVGRDQSLALAIKQLRESGFKGQFLSVNCLDEPAVWDIAGNTVDNAIFSSAYVDLQGSEAAINFASKYRDKYKTAPSYVVVYGYTIMKYLIPILREHRGDRSKILESLKKLNIESIRGRLSVEPNGDVLSPVAVYRVVGKKKEMILNPQGLSQVTDK